MAVELVEICEPSSGKAESLMHSDALIAAREPKREAAQPHKSQPRPFEQLTGEAYSQETKLLNFVSIDDCPSDQVNKIGIQAQSDAGEYEDTIFNTAEEQQCNENTMKYNRKLGGMRGGRDKERHEQENRRRLARGPRGGGATVASETMQNMFLLPSVEDHRVVSTEYQSSGTQALMRVTLLAAGFVIGAKGNSARLIGQATGAVVQSWTETSYGDPAYAVPTRVFRIQGKKPFVGTAVNLIEQAVEKYRDLCECKRRGEFVQREHVINGVEFYYQPPPKRTLEHENLQKLSNSYEDIQPPHLPSSSPNPNPWYHTNLHTNTNSDHNHHTNNNANFYIPPRYSRQYLKYPNPNHFAHNVMGLHMAHPLAFPRNDVWAMPQFHSQRCNSYNNLYQRHVDFNILALNKNFKGPGGLHDWPGSNSHQKDQLISKDEVEFSDQKKTVASLENKLQQIGMDNQEEENSIRNRNENKVVDPWSILVQHRHEQISSSLFSFFGCGEPSVPVATGQAQSQASKALSNYDSATPAFDFSSYEFLGGRFPAFSFASAINSRTRPIDTVPQGSEEQLTCAVCIHQQAAAFRFTGCRHCVCASCVEGESKCPICGKENQSIEQLDGEIAGYHLWNCLPDV